MKTLFKNLGNGRSSKMDPDEIVSETKTYGTKQKKNKSK